MRSQNREHCWLPTEPCAINLHVESLEQMNYVSWVEIFSERVGGGMDLFLLKKGWQSTVNDSVCNQVFPCL